MRMSAVALWGTLLCGTGLSLGGVARFRPMMVLIGACLVLPFLFYVIHTNLWYAGWLAAIGNFVPPVPLIRGARRLHGC